MQSLFLLLMPGDFLLFLVTGIKETSVWKTAFVSDHLDQLCPTRGRVDVFFRPSLGFCCNVSRLHTDNLSIGTKRVYKMTLTEWLKVPNSRYHCS